MKTTSAPHHGEQYEDLGDTILVEEVARRLRLGINQTYAGLERGEIPARRIGRRWIIGRIAFEEWLRGGGSKAA